MEILNMGGVRDWIRAAVGRSLLLVILLLGCWFGVVGEGSAAIATGLAPELAAELAAELAPGPGPSPYQMIAQADPEGIGKLYEGREIAQVMGHPGAGWLERASRRWEEQPTRAIANLDLQPTDVVADIGAGTGYFSFRMAARVAKVYAVDVQPEMLEIVTALKQRNQVENVKTVLGTEMNPNLPPGSIDLALMVDAYHEFAYPLEMMTGIVSALRPGGRVVLLEYRGENPLILIKRLHKMTEAQVRREMAIVGLTFVENRSVLPQQHFLVFQKPLPM